MCSLFFLFSVLISVNIAECFKTVLRNDLTRNSDASLIFPGSEREANEAAAKLSDLQHSVHVHWPKARVPFVVEHHEYDYLVSRKIRAAMDAIEAVSCVRFVSAMHHNCSGYYLHFTNKHRERKCVHNVHSRPGGGIVVVLGYDCLDVYQILHSIMHGLGFIDEVDRLSRSLNVRVMWENIHPEYRALYRLSRDDPVPKVPYDTSSLMEFHSYAFSKNGRTTVRPTHHGVVIQPTRVLSHFDKEKIQVLFKKECELRDVGALLDTCKDTLHAADLNTKEFTDIGWTEPSKTTEPNEDAANELDEPAESADETTVRYRSTPAESADETTHREVRTPPYERKRF